MSSLKRIGADIEDGVEHPVPGNVEMNGFHTRPPKVGQSFLFFRTNPAGKMIMISPVREIEVTKEHTLIHTKHSTYQLKGDHQ